MQLPSLLVLMSLTMSLLPAVLSAPTPILFTAARHGDTTLVTNRLNVRRDDPSGFSFVPWLVLYRVWEDIFGEKSKKKYNQFAAQAVSNAREGKDPEDPREKKWLAKWREEGSPNLLPPASATGDQA